MKRCPTCDKTFADGMKFCQTDGTVLVDDAPVADPYKTIVSNQSEMPAPPVDPFKTMVASPPIKVDDDENLLQLPEEPDAMKTMIVSQDEVSRESQSEADENAPLDLPPVPSAPLIEPQTPALDAPAAAKDSGFSSGNKPPKSDSNPLKNDFSGQSPYGNTDNLPIPSPFQDSMAPGGFQPPSNSPFNDPKPPFKEPEPMFGDPQPEPVVQSPFGQTPFGQSPPTPFGQAEPFNQPLGQAEWTPPPVPVAGWQDQGLGANTPFQPPGASVGQNQTLAIVSLVCGVLSVICCFSVITGPAGIITGFIAKNKADQEPAQYGGRGMALAGMITGGIGTVIGILVIILQILGAFAGRF